jgi:tRNA (Thr-GGU) A37 N-methylase
LDLLDGTPILDIKPYIPAFDSFPDANAGWMDMIDGGNYLESRLVFIIVVMFYIYSS